MHFIFTKQTKLHLINLLWGDCYHERLRALMEQKIITFTSSLHRNDRNGFAWQLVILKNEFGSRHAPTLAALETHTQQQHPALNMNKGQHTSRAHTDKNKSYFIFQNSRRKSWAPRVELNLCGDPSTSSKLSFYSSQEEFIPLVCFVQISQQTAPRSAGSLWPEAQSPAPASSPPPEELEALSQQTAKRNRWHRSAKDWTIKY